MCNSFNCKKKCWKCKSNAIKDGDRLTVTVSYEVQVVLGKATSKAALEGRILNELCLDGCSFKDNDTEGFLIESASVSVEPNLVTEVTDLFEEGYNKAPEGK